MMIPTSSGSSSRHRVTRGQKTRRRTHTTRRVSARHVNRSATTTTTPASPSGVDRHRRYPHHHQTSITRGAKDALWTYQSLDSLAPEMRARLCSAFLLRPRTLLLATIKRFRAADGIACRFLDSISSPGIYGSHVARDCDRRRDGVARQGGDLQLSSFLLEEREGQ